MAEEHIIHEHSNGGNNAAILVAVFLLALILLLFYFGLPALRGATGTSQVNVPGKIDVNLNQGGTK